jgi:hypothetical protein
MRGFPVSFGRLVGRVIGLSGDTRCKRILEDSRKPAGRARGVFSLQYLAPARGSPVNLTREDAQGTMLFTAISSAGEEFLVQP